MIALVDNPAEFTRAELVAQLAAMQCKIVTLAVIEQAKGALMLTYGLSAEEAFGLLRYHSQTRNVKLRAIAAELTSRLSNGPTSTQAITQFDRLIDDVTRSLQTSAGESVEAHAQGSPVDMASLFSQIAVDRDTRVAPRAVPTAAPGITLAQSRPGPSAGCHQATGSPGADR